jgi:hypothetical protein
MESGCVDRLQPIPLNAEQEQAAKAWAADDRLWTTQDTVEFNLRTFARVVLASHQEEIARLDQRRRELETANGEISEELSLKIDAQAEQIATLQAEKERWRSAAFYKIRTWDALQGMHRAGDSVEYIAEQYGVPVQWVEFVMFPENDLDARYARPSDRTKTAKADRDAALQELKALRAENARLKAEHAK